tara:strand:- start:2606 stop:3346 length:741 start_codon:yes stop_codon:yes gene_type:complete
MDGVESRDHLLGGKLSFRQPKAGYRVAIDPIFLAASLQAEKGTRVLELGCGSGAASLCLLSRLATVDVSALEVQASLADLARRNAQDNCLAERFSLYHGDLLQLPSALGRGFDQVMMNPPYDAAGRGSAAGSLSKHTAHQEGAATLADWVRQGLRCLKPQGWLTVVHRAARLDDLLAALHPKCGAIEILPLWPKAGQPAKRVLIRGRKGGKAPARLLPGLVLHDDRGGFTAQAQTILRDGGALSWA